MRISRTPDKERLFLETSPEKHISCDLIFLDVKFKFRAVSPVLWGFLSLFLSFHLSDRQSDIDVDPLVRSSQSNERSENRLYIPFQYQPKPPTCKTLCCIINPDEKTRGNLSSNLRNVITFSWSFARSCSGLFVISVKFSDALVVPGKSSMFLRGLSKLKLLKK